MQPNRRQFLADAAGVVAPLTLLPMGTLTPARKLIGPNRLAEQLRREPLHGSFCSARRVARLWADRAAAIRRACTYWLSARERSRALRKGPIGKEAFLEVTPISSRARVAWLDPPGGRESRTKMSSRLLSSNKR